MSTASPRVAAVSLAADVAAVLLFVLVGRGNHRQDATVLGALETAWPFLAALGLGWLVMRAWRHPLRVWPTGVGVWAIAVVGGMVTRGLIGEGVQASFIVVTTLVLGGLFLGWRSVIRLVGRRCFRHPPGRRFSSG